MKKFLSVIAALCLATASVAQYNSPQGHSGSSYSPPGGGGAPTGAAGGSLAGTYPNPTLNPAASTTFTALQTFNAGIAMPATNSAGTAGVILQNGLVIFHSYQAPNTPLGTPGPVTLMIGPGVGNFTNTGDTNIGIGGYDWENVSYPATLSSLTSGNENIAIGFSSLGSLTFGSNDTAVGAATGEAITTGNNDSYYGSNNSQGGTGSQDCIFGTGCMPSQSVGNNNAVFGFQCFFNTAGTTGNEDNLTGFGAFAGYNMSSGSNITSVGYYSLGKKTSGFATMTNDVALGAFAGAYSVASNEFYVNNQDRTNYAGDQTLSLLYGTFASTAAAQKLTINAGTVTLSQLNAAGGVITSSTGALSNNGGHSKTVYAAGTVYTYTASDAAITFGTTSPSITIDQAGTYMIFSRVNSKYVAATYAANQTLTCHLHRTNNTPADISNATTTLTTRVITTITDDVGISHLPMVIYTTANTNDAIALYGSVSATPSAGSVTATEADIEAVRIY